MSYKTEQQKAFVVKKEIYHKMRIPERDVMYIVLSVYLLMLIHR